MPGVIASGRCARTIVILGLDPEDSLPHDHRSIASDINAVPGGGLGTSPRTLPPMPDTMFQAPTPRIGEVVHHCPGNPESQDVLDLPRAGAAELAHTLRAAAY